MSSRLFSRLTVIEEKGVTDLAVVQEIMIKTASLTNVIDSDYHLHSRGTGLIPPSADDIEWFNSVSTILENPEYISQAYAQITEFTVKKAGYFTGASETGANITWKNVGDKIRTNTYGGSGVVAILYFGDTAPQ